MDNTVESFEYKGYSVRIYVDEDPMSPLDNDYVIKVYAPLRRHSIGNTEEDAPKGTKVAFPFYAHIHGGIAVSLGSFSDPWDSGRAGTIYVDNDDLEKEFNGDPELAKTSITAWFEGGYKPWVEGDVYGYVIRKDPEEAADESCWGMYGFDYCKESAIEAVDVLVESELEARKCANEKAAQLAAEAIEMWRHV